MHPKLAELVAQLVQPQGLSLLACVPSPAMWLPQLESCAVQVHTGDQLALLADGLQRAEARGLRALHVNDSRPPEDRRAAPARLPALADLPQLHTLVSWAPGMAADALQPIGMWRGPECTPRPWRILRVCRSALASSLWRPGSAATSPRCCAQTAVFNLTSMRVCCARACSGLSCGAARFPTARFLWRCARWASSPACT